MENAFPMSKWKNEDDIKAELRVLTGELKRLREELRSMLSPPKPSPSRAFLHRQSWPQAVPAEPVAQAADRKPPRKRRKK
jgi:hypothetical protein